MSERRKPISDTHRFVLERLNHGRPMATHWLKAPAGRDQLGTRRLLHRMAALGLVEGIRSSGGMTLWWKIAPAGLALLPTPTETSDVR